MTSREIRQTFLQFFADKQHTVVASAPIVLKNDPTLMFTNAGMVPFKDYFLGNAEPETKRVADTQKCLRVSGKHNDLEEVGLDTYHHTMFEMLGNWSFGDYFKKEAISWAWELLTDRFGLDPDRLYVTVYEGDQKAGVERDNEAVSYWRELLPEDRILYFDAKDNFWEMGDTGPCGPCSEIHFDMRDDEERSQVPGADLVNNDHPYVIEIWNLVFIQYNRRADGTLTALPAKHIDTGMGFERLCMAVQGKRSNYDSDVFAPLIGAISSAAGCTYGTDEKTDIAVRVVADHIRGIAFPIADGQLPSNTGAGYVIRRILRRAVRYGYTFLGFHTPFLFQLLDVLADQFGDVFPEIRSQKEFVTKVIQEEEASFLRTLEQGLKRLDSLISTHSQEDQKNIAGSEAFELYDTYGFPLDLTQLIARENGFTVDDQGFVAEMEKQKSRSKADAKKDVGDWTEILQDSSVTFLGYESLESDARIVKYREVREKKGKKFQIVLDKTPFYAESGGQVGDRGILSQNGTEVAVVDTVKENDLIIHITETVPADPDAPVHAIVDGEKRRRTMNNHTATHLMHAALRQVLGTHVEQRGSLVNEKVLRFDFSHFSRMTDEEIRRVEQIVNRQIRANIPLDEKRDVPFDDAQKLGAMALFGEKYGATVRVITFDPEYSIELCGGTHVDATGRIGSFRIVSEGSIAAGIRRVEAVTAEAADEYVNGQIDTLKSVRTVLRDPDDVVTQVSNLVEERSRLEKELQRLFLKQADQLKDTLLASSESADGVTRIIGKVDLPDAAALKKLAFDLDAEIDRLFLVLAADVGGRPQIVVVVSKALVEEKGLNASTIVRELATEIKGGGGGKPFYAQAGGKDVSGLDRVVDRARALP